jgi:hypothetical protein
MEKCRLPVVRTTAWIEPSSPRSGMSWSPAASVATVRVVPAGGVRKPEAIICPRPSERERPRPRNHAFNVQWSDESWWQTATRTSPGPSTV